ncbi:hypothetical protein HDG34_004992 [Paraburkholderia sp. HC6.4b]|uniref:C1 family peptidase n=1 Tax=unclassified Paraburkholderia TaxID=2615204 RepID=UPI001621EE34|nr:MULTISPECIES: C1 family peptidase [unclassified Paraburkholderia]MBB5411035.1 hypothetical protein [Paraburkholderia sp. HC6.4b]MBB5455151.1 hypothetical protein [Paraburkholderia sp. Kb1A]
MPITLQVDLRPRLGPVFDQSDRATCLAFSVSDVHAFHVNGASPFKPLSVEHLVYHASPLPLPKLDPTVGLTPIAVAAAVGVAGQPHSSAYPYNPNQKPGAALPVPPILAPLMSRKFDVHPFSLALANQLIGTSEQGKPAVLGLQMTEVFFDPKASHADSLIDGSANDPQYGGHAVILAGRGTDDSNGQDVYLIKNSWGTGWGMGGYAWLTSAYLQHHAKLLMVA